MLTVLPIPSNISSQLIYFIHSSCSLNSLPQMAPGLLFPHWELLDCSLSLWVCFCFAAAAAKSLQSCPTLSDPTDGSPPGSAVPGILQVRTLEWVAISFSSAWKWKVKVKSLSPNSQRPHGLQPTRLLHIDSNVFFFFFFLDSPYYW